MKQRYSVTGLADIHRFAKGNTVPKAGIVFAPSEGLPAVKRQVQIEAIYLFYQQSVFVFDNYHFRGDSIPKYLQKCKINLKNSRDFHLR
jgi:hypothetical protein